MCTLDEAVAEHPELVEPHLGTLVTDRDKFTAQNTAAWRGGALRLRPGRRARASKLSSRRSCATRPRRSLALADRGRGGRGGRGCGAVDVGRRGSRGLLQPGDRADRGRGRFGRVPLRTGPVGAGWILGSQRAQVGRDAKLHWVGSGSARARGSSGWRPTSTAPGATARVTGAYVGHGSSTSTTTRRRSTPRPTRLGPRLPRHSARPGDGGLERHDQGRSRRPAHRRLPGEPQPAAVDGAHADAIPGLEIEANDVRCTHAATVARLDEGQIFYLQSRGLTRARGGTAPGRRLPRGDRGATRGLALPARHGLGRAGARARDRAGVGLGRHG